MMRAGTIPLILGGVVALAAMGSVGYIATRVSEESRQTQAMVVHTNEVLAEISHCFARTKGAESAIRGSILSGDSFYDQAYQDDRREIAAGMARLRELTRDNASQQERLARLDAVIADRLKSLEASREMARKEGLAAVGERMRIGPGKTLSEDIRAAFFEMDAEETRLLKIRTGESQRVNREARTFSFLVLGIATILLLGSFGVGFRLAASRASVERELDQFFSTSLDMMGIASLKTGRFTRVSPSWEKTLGWTMAEITSKPWLDFVHPDDRAATIAEGAKLAQGASVLSFENRYQCRDGSYRWLSWKTPAPLPGSSTLYAVARDVTELRRREEEIRRLNGELARTVEATVEANKDLESFSYSISHDLRAPLRAIDGFSRILEEDYGQKLDAEGLRLFGVVRQNARQMGQLIDDLLQFSRLGRKEVAKAAVDVRPLVGEVVSELREAEPDREVEVVIGELPSVRSDRALLRQVWVNLISNALKYSRTRKPSRVEIGSEAKNGELVFYVRDNGVGFDMKHADKLFGVFQRLHSPQQFEGTGVGLAIVDRVVRRHGGRVWAEGTVDGGATFRFTIPK